jgi:hypothetical protein
VTKVLSTEEAKRAIEGSGKDFGKSRRAHAHDLLLVSVLVSEAELKLSNKQTTTEITPTTTSEPKILAVLRAYEN